MFNYLSCLYCLCPKRNGIKYYTKIVVQISNLFEILCNNLCAFSYFLFKKWRYFYQYLLHFQDSDGSPKYNNSSMTKVYIVFSYFLFNKIGIFLPVASSFSRQWCSPQYNNSSIAKAIPNSLWYKQISFSTLVYSVQKKKPYYIFYENKSPKLSKWYPFRCLITWSENILQFSLKGTKFPVTIGALTSAMLKKHSTRTCILYTLIYVYNLCNSKSIDYIFVQQKW